MTAKLSGFVRYGPFRRRGVADAIAEIDGKADRRPDDKTNPGRPTEAHHHDAAHEYARRRGEPHPRRAELPPGLWCRDPQDHDADTHGDKRRQGADRHEIG